MENENREQSRGFEYNWEVSAICAYGLNPLEAYWAGIHLSRKLGDDFLDRPYIWVMSMKPITKAFVPFKSVRLDLIEEELLAARDFMVKALAPVGVGASA